jgi:hypothetical protein
MKPPTFTKAEEPLDADAWVRAIEAKFSAFVLPCFEERKASFATLQLRGEALMWARFCLRGVGCDAQVFSRVL